MKISMGAWSFTFGPHAAEPKSLETVCRRLSAAGFDGIELCGYPPHVTLEAYPNSASRSALRRSLDDFGLGVSGFSADLTAVNPVVAGNRSAYLVLFQRQLELCAELGAPFIRIDSGAAPGSLPDDEYRQAFHRLADLWRDCSDLARKAQVRIAWEFEPGFVFNKPSEVVALHDEVGHPWFRVLFDTAHAHMCSVRAARQHGAPEVLEGGVLAMIEKLKGRVGGVHVVDSDGSLYFDETSMHRPFHAGVVAWPEVIPALLANFPVEWWCIDLAFCPDAWGLVDVSLSQLKELLVNAGETPPQPKLP